MIKIYPRCKTENHIPYVNAQGYYFPCCWIAHEYTFNQLKEFMGDHIEDFKVNKHDIADIKNSCGMKLLEDSWDTDTPFIGCMETTCTTPFNPEKTSVFSQINKKNF